MLASADLKVGVPELLEEERAGDEGHECDSLLVELAELIEPADRVVGLRLPVSEVDDSGVTVARI